MLADLHALWTNVSTWFQWFWAVLPWIMSVWFVVYGIMGRRIEATPDKSDDEAWSAFQQLMWAIGKIVRFDFIPPKTDPIPEKIVVDTTVSPVVPKAAIVIRSGPRVRLARLALRVLGKDVLPPNVTDEQLDAVLELAENETGLKVGEGAFIKWLFDNKDKVIGLLKLVLLFV